MSQKLVHKLHDKSWSLKNLFEFLIHPLQQSILRPFWQIFLFYGGTMAKSWTCLVFQCVKIWSGSQNWKSVVTLGSLIFYCERNHFVYRTVVINDKCSEKCSCAALQGVKMYIFVCDTHWRFSLIAKASCATTRNSQ